MRYLFGLIVIILITLVILVNLFFYLNQHRDYWHRVLIPLKPCPFRQDNLASQIRARGGRHDREGIISYSLYGNYHKYTPTLLSSLDRIKDLLPTWQARIYVDISVNKETRKELLARGAEVIAMGPHLPHGHEAALWRFLPLEQDLPFVSADADDLFDQARYEEIMAWLNSGQPFCSFIPFVTYIPLDAGKWGSRGKQVPEIRERLSQYCEHWFGFDEAFLKNEIWPIARVKGCYFSSYYRFDQWVTLLWIVIIVVVVILLYLIWTTRL